ncbi:cytochrome c oxidase subunit 3 [Novosphingobium colocasiae]|uniref:cytochrome c oxidase subunit 3 n=1 Tax=Novosphingobium colocasiae TaxID=1256513 RepID=UPI0035B02B38
MSIATAQAHHSARVPGEAGIWIFIAGDLLAFTLFFVLIALGNGDQPQVFARGRASLDVGLGVANTLLLLTGSWLVAAGVETSRKGAGRVASRYFLAGAACGLGFVANKFIEWSHLIRLGASPQTDDFYMFFFVFTGIHLFHVLLGTVYMLVLSRACAKRPAGPERDRFVECGGLFWHLVDLLWIVLFALLYLI